MKKFFDIAVAVIALVLAVAVTGCSDKDDIDPDDYVTSYLSGEYGKGSPWKLHVTVNGSPVENSGSVEFRSKELKEADLKFVNVIPGESRKEYKNVPLDAKEEGLSFTIADYKDGQPMTISGLVSLGEMTVDIKTGK